MASPPVMSHRLHHPLRAIGMRIAAVAVAMATGLALGEIAFRLADIRPERYPRLRFQLFHSGRYQDCNPWGSGLIKQRSRLEHLGVRMGEYVPGAQFQMVYASNPRGYFDDDDAVTFTINSLGLRGPEISDEKPEGVSRILAIGDSFTFGAGVRDQDTFVRRLERRLNEQSAHRRQYEVLNAGVEGYNTRDQVLYLEHRWLELLPDLVLIGFYLNDAYDDATFRNKGQELGVYLQPDGLAHYSYIYDVLQHSIRRRKVSREIQEYYSLHYFASADEFLRTADAGEVDWSDCRASIFHAANLARKHSFRIALVIFPEFYRLSDDYPFAKIHRLVSDTCRSAGMPVLDLLDVYKGHDAEKFWVHPTDHHPNEIAHAMATDAILRFFENEALLDGASSPDEE